MIVVDTDVLIAHLRGVPAARAWMLATRAQHRLIVSVVTVTEITGGMRSVERADVGRMLAALDPAPVTELVARRAGDLMREHRRSHAGIGIADYLIAATAETHGAQLATLNVKHFPMFPRLKRPFTLS